MIRRGHRRMTNREHGVFLGPIQRVWVLLAQSAGANIWLAALNDDDDAGFLFSFCSSK
jgi:hypothetical protein